VGGTLGKSSSLCPTLERVTDEQLSRAVSAEVRRLLEERGMSGNQLAKAAGMEQTTIARKLRGARAFDLDDLAAIAPVLDVRVADLIEWAQKG
jgi:transcriptional regulator with XRE-family HTH domain